MKYNINFNNENYVESYFVDENGLYEEQDLIKIFDNFQHRINCYKKVGDNFVLDSTKENEIIAKEEKENELSTLHKNLNDSDYLVSRTFEQVMALENPLTFVSDLIKITKEFREKYAETIANRETWRKRIEELENK